MANYSIKGHVNAEYHDIMDQRNAYFNAIYLDLMATPGQDLNITHDIEDQLMRMDINHFPDRMYGIEPIPASYLTCNWSYKCCIITQEFAWGSLETEAFPDFEVNGIYYSKPLSVEYCQTGIFLWEHYPYERDSNYTNPAYENPGLSFTVPYWICRADGFDPSTR